MPEGMDMEALKKMVPPGMLNQVMGPDGKPDMAKVQQMMAQMGMGGGAGGMPDMAKLQQMMAGMGGGAAKPAPVTPAVHNQLNIITSHNQLATYIKELPGVVCNFGAAWCGPCKNFKPIYTADALANTNKNLFWCYIDEA